MPGGNTAPPPQPPVRPPARPTQPGPQPLPPAGKAPSKVLLLIVGLAVALLVSLVLNLWQAFGGPGDEGFDSPESAARHYVYSLGSAASGEALRSYGMKTVAAKMDSRAQAEQVKQWRADSPYPPADAQDHPDLAGQALRQAAIREVYLRSLQLIADESVDIAQVRSGSWEQITDDMDPTRLDGGLTLVEFKTVESTPGNLAGNSAETCKQLGADECAEAMMLISRDKSSWALGLQFLRYGDGWFVAPAKSSVALNLASSDARFGLLRSSEGEFKQLVAAAEAAGVRFR